MACTPPHGSEVRVEARDLNHRAWRVMLLRHGRGVVTVRVAEAPCGAVDVTLTLALLVGRRTAPRALRVTQGASLTLDVVFPGGHGDLFLLVG